LRTITDIDVMQDQPAAEFAWDYPNPFTLTVVPGAADIDGLNHTNNAVYVRWCEAIGWAHSEALGLSLADWTRLDRALAIRRGEYDYLLPSVQGDELLLGTWITGASRVMLERRFQLINPRQKSTVMRGRWDVVSIELSTGRPRRLPPEFADVYLPAMVAGAKTD
jgi:acyl-CoA thioester hydrolase